MRGLVESKSRLAPVLDQAQRVALNRRLLARTLAVLGEWHGALARCIVVSPCRRALALARECGAMTLCEGARAVGLNQAVALGVAQAAAHGASHVLILPGDLPNVGVGALNALARAAGRRHVVLAPDKTGTGTNALLVEAAARFEFSFGAASLTAHQAAAARAGLTVRFVRRSELRFDLDTPEDLAACGRARCPPRGRPARPGRKSGFPWGDAGVNMRVNNTPGEEEP